MVKKTNNYFTCFIFFAVFPNTSLQGKELVCKEKNILLNLTNSQEPEPVFLAPSSRSRSRSKIMPGSGAAWEKIQEQEPLEKSREPLKNLPAPQPYY